MGEYYERIGHPGSAVFCYELVRRRFSGTRYADLATERKEYLLALMRDGHPSVGTDPFAIAGAKWKDLTGKNQPAVANQTGTPVGPNAAVLPAGGLQPGVMQGGIQPGGIQPGLAPPNTMPSGSVPPGYQPGVMPLSPVPPAGYQPGAMPQSPVPSGGYQPGMIPSGGVVPGSPPGYTGIPSRP